MDIYPNPAKDFINITGDLEGVNAIKIYDSTGKLVEQLVHPLGNSISTAHLSSGFYAVSFLTDKGVVLKKLLLTH